MEGGVVLPAQTVITHELIQAVLGHYRLPLAGTHGLPHWGRVLENGRFLGAQTGARMDVVDLFAVFHDSRRRNEAIDPGHGRRGARLAATLRGRWYDLDETGFQLLVYACQAHTDGLTEADITIQTCWDADRLDLPRVGILASADFLCTAPAQEPATIAWARDRAERRLVLPFLETEWGVPLRDLGV